MTKRRAGGSNPQGRESAGRITAFRRQKCQSILNDVSSTGTEPDS